MAWLEYQDTGDGVAFTNTCTSRLGFRNAFEFLPRAKGSSISRKASNSTDSRFAVQRFFRRGKDPLRALIGIPGKGDKDLFDEWVNSPGISGDELVSSPTAEHPVDLLAVSGHGGGGDVWGDLSGETTGVSPPWSLLQREQFPRSGRLKCLISPACTNASKFAAKLWRPAFNHPQPLHIILGYHGGYNGGPHGAAILAKFGDLLVDEPSRPMIEAWRIANESIRPIQPWAALAALAGEGLNITDWRNGNLPPLANVDTMLHFSAENPDGEEIVFGDDDFDVRWVMDGNPGIVIDMNNNGAENAHIGLFAGKPGKIRITSNKPERDFKRGQEVYLFMHRYRPDRDEIDIDALLKFDDNLLSPHPNTGQPVANVEVGRFPRTDPRTDSVRIVVPDDTGTLQLGFTVKPDAPKHYKQDGPENSFGRFLLQLVDQFSYIHLPHLHPRETVFAHVNTTTFAAADGALLRP